MVGLAGDPELSKSLHIFLANHFLILFFFFKKKSSPLFFVAQTMNFQAKLPGHCFEKPKKEKLWLLIPENIGDRKLSMRKTIKCQLNIEKKV